MDFINSLQKTLKRAKNSPFYKRKLPDKKCDLDSLDDFSEIPLTTKEELRNIDSPYDLLACDEKKIVQMNTTSGTTGEPTFSFFTKKDLIKGSKELAKAWKAFGVNSESRVQFIMSYGLFSGALLNTVALQHLGSFVIPAGIQPFDKQIRMIEKFKPDTIVATPSFFLHLQSKLQKRDRGDLLQNWSVERGIAAGEIYSDEVREFIESKLNITIHDHYGLCELYSGFAYECECREGLHLLDDIVFGEIIDPETLEVLGPGEEGELVVTSIHKEALPIVRYRTGDITKIKKTEKFCKCEERFCTSFMIDRIKRRSDDLLFVKGVKINPYVVRDFLINSFGDKIHSNIKIVYKESVSFSDPKLLVSLKESASKKVLDDIREALREETFVNFKVNHKPYSFFKDKSNKSKLVIYK